MSVKVDSQNSLVIDAKSENVASDVNTKVSNVKDSQVELFPCKICDKFYRSQIALKHHTKMSKKHKVMAEEKVLWGSARKQK